MITSILIANRGEIACRVIKTAQHMNIRTIAVYSVADAASLHVKMADEAYLIGEAKVSESYLVAEKIIQVALDCKADAIHPGYGFLSENAHFAQLCANNNIKFIGPSVAAINSMGLKDAAKDLMQKANVPIVPGYMGDNQAVDYLLEQAQQIGFPVMIKAVAGGGGKGMRRVDAQADFVAALEAAKREASSAFGNDIVLIEKFILNPRHIEIQVFGDQLGNYVYLFERDCSLQRRHQKVVEEAPAPLMNEPVRQAMGEAAVRAAKAVDYEGAGTVEFIVDSANGLDVEGFWFMEMNTRLQVEHPITEAITSEDLVQWQILVASGEPLPKTQAQLSITGHAVEVRLYAEDTDNGFLPSIGKIAALKFDDSEGIRIDTGVEQGSVISPYYDPMIAKIIAHAPNREQALSRLANALRQCVIGGVKVNIRFLRDLLEDKDFKAQRFDTGFIDAFLSKEQPEPDLSAIADQSAATLANITLKHRSAESLSPWAREDSFDMALGDAQRSYSMDVLINGQRHRGSYAINDGNAKPIKRAENSLMITHCDNNLYITDQGETYTIEKVVYDDGGKTAAVGQVLSPMPGNVFSLFVNNGDEVAVGDQLAIVEAMKMEHCLMAEIAGTVVGIEVKEGDQVTEGQLILTIE